MDYLEFQCPHFPGNALLWKWPSSLFLLIECQCYLNQKTHIKAHETVFKTLFISETVGSQNKQPAEQMVSSNTPVSLKMEKGSKSWKLASMYKFKVCLWSCLDSFPVHFHKFLHTSYLDFTFHFAHEPKWGLHPLSPLNIKSLQALGTWLLQYDIHAKFELD